MTGGYDFGIMLSNKKNVTGAEHPREHLQLYKHGGCGALCSGHGTEGSEDSLERDLHDYADEQREWWHGLRARRLAAGTCGKTVLGCWGFVWA